MPYAASVSEVADLAALYRDSRQRLAELLSGLDAAALSTPVPACPGWSVRDVLAHLVSIPEDAAAGRLVGLPTEEFTAEQVARLADVTVAELLTRWSASAPDFEQRIAMSEVWPAVIDLATHEQDIRGAIGQPGARDCAAIRQSMNRLLTSLKPPVPVHITTEDGTYIVGPAGDAAAAAGVTGVAGGAGGGGGASGAGGGGEASGAGGASGAGRAGIGDSLTLLTSRFEAFRWRMGRRSPAQLAAMNWSADPPPAVLAGLTIFGPAPTDIHE